jgi:hypothetical protein
LHGDTLTGVQAAELNTGLIGILGHFTPQGIDLPDQMSFSQAAYGRIAAHGGYMIEVNG